MTLEWPFGALWRGSYGTVLADPPWNFVLHSEKGHAKSAHAQYQCMDTAVIKALPVADLMLPDAVCVMWATAPMLPEAIDTMRAWGFKFITAGTWAKQSSTGEKWSFGPGYWFRSAAEFYLLGKRGKPSPRVRNIRNLIVAPTRGHSRKPDEMRANIEALCPAPYVELFGRERAQGWDTWGNEADKFAPAPSAP